MVRRTRGKTVCACGALWAALGGRSASPLDVGGWAVVRLIGVESMQLGAAMDVLAWALL